MMAKEYYSILGVKDNATSEEIRLAFHNKTREIRKNISLDEKARNAKLTEINRAYTVLKNSKTRKDYDSGNYEKDEDGSYQNPNDGAFSNGFRFNGFGNSGFGNTFFDIFEIINNNSEKLDIEKNMLVKFKDLVLGVKQSITYNRKKRCNACKGTGAAEMISCRRCGGGKSKSFFPCQSCNGKGFNQIRQCLHCKGHGTSLVKEQYYIDIPKYWKTENILSIVGKGNESSKTGKIGDLNLKIISESNYFKRKDDDIYVSVDVSFLDCILGGDIRVITLEGETKVKIEPGTKTGHKIILKNRGCYNKNGDRGNFYAIVNISIPDKIKGANKAALEDIRTNTSWNPNNDYVLKASEEAEK